jgi:hypothetical protein
VECVGFQAGDSAAGLGHLPASQAPRISHHIVLARQGACIRFLLSKASPSRSHDDLNLEDGTLEDSVRSAHDIHGNSADIPAAGGRQAAGSSPDCQSYLPLMFSGHPSLQACAAAKDEVNLSAGSVFVDPVFWMATAVMNKNSTLPLVGAHMLFPDQSLVLLGDLLSFPVFQIPPRSSEALSFGVRLVLPRWHWHWLPSQPNDGVRVSDRNTTRYFVGRR